MIDAVISLVATLVNIYVLYTLYIRHGFPEMFSQFSGLVSAGLLAASATYFIMSVLMPRQYVEEEYDGEEDVQNVWNEINKPTQVSKPDPEIVKTYTDVLKTMPSQPTTSYTNNGGDFLSKAIAAAVSRAELKGRINIDVDIPEHEITIEGRKASVRAFMSFTTPEEPKAAVREKPQAQPSVVYVPTPPENPVEFIKRKLEEMKGGG